jgi:predicted GNAT family acetyltransferase
MKSKEYNNGEITILWNAEKCTHSGICVKTLPNVYNPKERPWIKIENATSKELIEQVGKCPSTALSIKKMVEIKKEDDGRKGKYIIFEDNIFAGEMTFTWAGNSKFIIDHTGIEESFKGKGFGKKLVMKAVELARKENVKILPLCPFAKAVFNKNKDLADIEF